MCVRSLFTKNGKNFIENNKVVEVYLLSTTFQKLKQTKDRVTLPKYVQITPWDTKDPQSLDFPFPG